MRLVSGCGSSDAFTDKLSRLTEKAKQTAEYRRQSMEWERQKAYEYTRGKAEGKQEKAVEDARNLLIENISPEIIAKCTNLSIEQVLKLQTELSVTA